MGWLCKTQRLVDWGRLAVTTAPYLHRNFRHRPNQRMELFPGCPQPTLVEIQIVPMRVNLVRGVLLFRPVFHELQTTLPKVGLTNKIKMPVGGQYD